jgi:hypothetical protein
MSDEEWFWRRRRRYRASPIHGFHQDGKLRRCQYHRAIGDRRPHEAATLQPLGDQPKAAAVPVQAFKIIAALVAENEQVPAERIRLNEVVGFCRQSIESIA